MDSLESAYDDVSIACDLAATACRARYVHYTDSKDEPFVPRPEAGHGLDEAGLFVYPEGYEEPNWGRRRRCVFVGPENLGRVEQSFTADEVGAPNDIIEIFVPADQLHLLVLVQDGRVRPASS